ncbi:vanadium-dependent haloperoxidase [Actinoplanes sp. CA-131856]
MRKTWIVVALSLAGGFAGAHAPTDIDSVRVWNGFALDAVRVTRATDADAARMYAMVNVAMYDAVNGLAGARARTPALVPGSGPRHADAQAAAASAAHEVLVALDPARAATYDARLATDLARLTRPQSGAAWGRHVGRAVVSVRTGDGSTPVESQPAGEGPGVFRAAWPGTQYRNVQPFAVADPGRYIPAGPPALTSVPYAGAYAEVAVLGNAARPDAELLATYQYWSLPAGSDQPPGEWLRIGLGVATARHLPLAEQTRLTALLTMGLADTTVATVGTKYRYRHWRPTTAIRETTDPTWSARAGSVGSTPEYVSGHSSYSGAGSAVLAGFFCDDAIAFTHTTDSAPGGAARAYPGFSSAASEAGRSRVYGGQHFEFSNQAGLYTGRGVAAEVLATRLLLRHGPTHVGACPR